MPAPRLPRGAFARLGIIALIAAFFFAGRLAHAAGRGGLEPASAGAAPIAARQPYVIAEAVRWIGAGKMTGLPGPWCADFVSLVLRAAGRAPLANRLAASALRYGPHLPAPRVGALAVMNHHVGFVEGIEPDGSIDLLSGNWGHRVARSIVPRALVVAFVEVR